MKKLFFPLLAFFVLLNAAADNVNFLSRPLTAGKAALTENAYIVSRLIDTANVSPELRLPVQLIYKSSAEKTGLFGYAWRSPQLESSARYDKDGVLWETPWGEKIKFFPKKEKPPKDAIKIELYEQAKKGTGFYAPYSEWEANTSKSDYTKSDNWVFTGKNNKKDWTFVYRNNRLRSITAPSGRTLEFNYEKDRLVSITQDKTAFVELSYSGNTVSSLKINGIGHELKYSPTKLRILPKTEKGNLISATRDCLVSVKRGDLNPTAFSYDDYGFLNGIRQGEYADELVIQHQTVEQRHAEVLARRDSRRKYSGPVNGRIVSDNQFKYSYGSPKPGNVVLSNQLNQKASYNFNTQTGVFGISEFSGKSYTIYYFMRYDVAYLGKVRKIVDGRDRDVLNFRYDRLSGNVTRVRDMAGNDFNFEYGPNGKLSLITRRAAEQNKPEPVRSFTYDPKGNLVKVSTLDADGKAVMETNLEYTQFREVSCVFNGQSKSVIDYNRFGCPVAVANVFGQTTRRELDAFNRMVSSTDFYGVTTFYTYTPAGLISRIERKDGTQLLNSLEIKYNGNGQPVSYTDQSGKMKKFERDAFGRVVRELFPDDTEVAYTYNKLGQLHTVLDQNKRTIKFDWNKFGLDAKTTPAGQLTDYVHDKYGLLARQVSKQGRDIAHSIQYEYDKFDRPVKLNYGKNDVETRTYDSWGKLLSTQRGDEKVTCRYDYFGRMTAKIGTKEKLFLVYNPYGQRTGRLIERDGMKMKELRSYDRFGRLKKIVSGDKTVEYVYNAQNQIHRQIINGKIIEFSYNKYGQLQNKRMMEK